MEGLGSWYKSIVHLKMNFDQIVTRHFSFRTILHFNLCSRFTDINHDLYQQNRIFPPKKIKILDSTIVRKITSPSNEKKTLPNPNNEEVHFRTGEFGICRVIFPKAMETNNKPT